MTQGWRWGGTAAVMICLSVGMASCREGGAPLPSNPPDNTNPPLEGPPPPADPDKDPPSQGEGDAGTPGLPLPPEYDAAAIHKENQRPGARDWRITRNAHNAEIEGYPLVATVTPGQRVPVAVNVSEPRAFRWFVYRLGYYSGLGAREVVRGGALPGIPQPPCPVDEATGLVTCQWTPTFEIETKDDWVRGVYVVKLVREDNYQRYVPFFVRDAHPRSEVVAMIPTATWSAYNTWGGTSLYDDKLGVMKKYGVSRAFQVSYDRPYYRGQGTGHLMLDELSLIQWLESQGLDVGYVTNEDLDERGGFLSAAKVLVLSGHDEYWTSTLRDRADQAVAEGRSLINLGANQAYWHVRLEPAKDGRPRRLVTCYKGDSRDPVGAQSPLRTVKFRDAPLSRPENALFGVMFSSRWHQFPFPTVITNPEHWALEGTGLQKGDTLWMTNGYEQDSMVQNGQTPSGVEVLADSPALSLQGAFGFSQMVVRQQGSAWIFSSGGIDFVQVLAGTQAADPRGARIVANVLYRALGRPVPADLVSFRPREPGAPRGPFASRVLTLAGQAGKRGNIDGPEGKGQLGAPVAVAVLPGGRWVVADALSNSVRHISAQGEIRTVLTGLNGPMGIAADAWGNVYVADSDNHCIRRLSSDGTATVFAGAVMAPGQADGLAQAARFNQPAGLAFTPGGDLLVADLGNGVIRRVGLAIPGNPVTTVPTDKWMYRPSAVAAAADGTLYVVETGMARVLEIRQGVVSLIAGSSPGYADGEPGSSQLLPYLGIAVLKDGSVAVADPGNYRIRRILFTADGKPSEVSTFAGTGRFGSRDGAGRSADFVLPAGLAVGADGTLYVADAGNALLRAVMP